jgi:hypothetical protein
MMSSALHRHARVPFSTSSAFTSSRRPLSSHVLPVQQRQRYCKCRASQQQEQQQHLLAAPFLLLPAALAGPAQAAQTAASADLILELAELDSKTAGAISAVLKPALTVASMLMIVRIVMSWYPEINGKEMPWSIAYTPTGVQALVV